MSRFGFIPAVRKEEPVAAASPVAGTASNMRSRPESAGFDLLDAKLLVHAKLID